MPRAGWLAGGALFAALAVSAIAVRSPIVAALGVVSLLTAAALVRTGGNRGAAALLVGAGAIALRIVLAGVLAPDLGVVPLRASVQGTWSAVVVSVGSTDGGVQRAVLQVRTPAGLPDVSPAPEPPPAVPGPPQAAPEPLVVYASLPRYPVLVPGDRIRFDGRLEPIPSDGTGFAGYLAQIGAEATTRVHLMELDAGSGGLLDAIQELRRAADEALARGLPEPEAGLASGIVVGRRDRVSRDVADDFATTGLSHVVAISGWNIALVGAVLGGLLAGMGLPRRARTIALLLAIAMYTLLAGGGASVIRAAVMGGVVLVAREAGRPGSAAAALGLAVWGLLMLDPAMATDIGFQLSVAATAGLLAWGEGVAGWLQARLPGRTGAWLAESLGVSLAAQAATLPLVLFHFGRLSLVAPLANLAVAPLVAPAMLAAVGALIGGLAMGAGAPPILLAPLSVAGWASLGAMVAIAHALAVVPLASVALPPPLDALAALLVAGAVAAVALRSRHGGARVPATGAPAAVRARTPSGSATRDRDTPVESRAPRYPRARRVSMLAVPVAGLLVAVILISAAGSPPRLSVTVMDVGQGDAILLQGPFGGRILIDGGPDPDRLMAVLDGRIPVWDRRIDLVVLSHPHEDHVAGLALLLQRYRVRTVAENGMLGAGPGDVAFRATLRASDTRPLRLAAGDHLDLDGVRLDVLWPLGGTVPATSPRSGKLINDTSIVFDLRYGARRMLLMGDVEEEIDPQLLAAGISRPGGPPLDVLKVAHHGSGTATSTQFLGALRPRVALVSAGLGNRYGHPAPRTMERLREHGTRALRTDLDGTLTVSTNGTDLHVATTGGRPRATLASPVPVSGQTASVPLVAPFLCAVPLPIEGRIANTAAASPATRTSKPHPPRGVPDDRPSRDSAADLEMACYDPSRDDPLPRAGRGPVRVALAAAATPATRVGRGGDSRIPGGARSPPWGPGRSPAHGERSAAP